MTLDDLDLFAGAAPGLVTEPRKCYRHQWVKSLDNNDGEISIAQRCDRCGHVKDATRSRRNKNNGKRGRSDELTVARMLGGQKMGTLGLPWDVELSGYLRVQCKKLDRWPSIAKVIEWLDAIPVGAEMRAVTLADTPGPGGKTRRLIVLELSEFVERHGKEPNDD